MTTPLSGTPDEITEHLAAAYRTDPTGTTLVLGHDWAQTVVNQIGNVIQERDDALGCLNRIAHAHVKHVDASGGTTGDCVECGETWPCPTSVWATSDRNPLATWDPADDEPCDAHPGAVVIAGMCGGCTIRPADFPTQATITKEN